MRHVLVHGYYQIKDEIVWKTHIIKGRVPSAIYKSVNQLKDCDRTIYYERCAFMEDVFADYDDVDDDTRMQLELINETLAELQGANKAFNKPRPKIGFVK